MRIVGGIFKGRIFNPNKKFTARPTTDIAKEGLFNILHHNYGFENRNAIDLFSGTGSIAYEFISRGCTEVIMVESNFQHVAYINEVLTNLNVKNAKVIRTDVFRFLPKCYESFDFVFADPPFEMKEIDEIPDAVIKSKALKPTGLFILEHSKSNNFSTHPNFTETRNYGKVNFSFFRHVTI